MGGADHNHGETRTLVSGAPEGPDAAFVARAEADRHRPRFHFTAPGGWLNDPNGLCQRDGVYHLFYQYNPYAPVHDRIHWGHATSRDLVTWRSEPVALTPSAGPDQDGCWSGVFVDDDGTPTLLYSGHRDSELESVCVATGSPDLTRWTKEPGNPVLEAPAALDLFVFRDHCAWREGRRWRQLVSAGIRGRGGAALLFDSPDLREWTYVGPFVLGDPTGAGFGGAAGSPDWTGAAWECVDLFHLTHDGGTDTPRSGRAGQGSGGGVDVLVFSAWDHETFHPLALTGRYEGDTFSPSAVHRIDLGGRAFYAPQSFQDASGRRVMLGWLQEERSLTSSVRAGWAGVMSLPRRVTVDDDRLSFAPVPEVRALRREHTAAVPADRGLVLAPAACLVGPSGDQLDLEIDLRLDEGGAAEVVVRASDQASDDAERTVLAIRKRADGVDVRLDRSRSSLDQTVRLTERAGQVPVPGDGRVRIRVLLDRSVLEIFVNGQPLSARVYPTRTDALGTMLRVPSDASPLTIERFEAWTMADR